jgi:predicted Zn-dependent protease
MSRALTLKLMTAAIGMTMALSACETLQKGTNILTSAGQKAGEVLKATETVRRTFADITEEEEYYIGRSVAALILHRYPVYNNNSLTQYINLVGNSVALNSDRPEIYAGYHFLILDSEEVNGLAAPGGMIFITKGLLRLCRDEEMLGLVLAHEVGHVSAKHGLRAIKTSRLVDAFRLIGTEAAKKYGSAELAQLTNIFEGALGDIAEQLIERGYSRSLEYEADELAIKFATRTGYDPGGLLRFLQEMSGGPSGAGAKGWFRTHPEPIQRIERIKKEIASLSGAPKIEAVRTQRFKQNIASLK